MTTLVQRARAFAEHVHATQLRKYTNEPYTVHLQEVAQLVSDHVQDDEATAAAWLHDCVEDQDVRLGVLAKEFGHLVALYVHQLTDPPVTNSGPKFNRAWRKVMDIDRLSKATPIAQSIKCADLISNTVSIVQHDPGFAKVYLPEKRATLAVLDRANKELHDLAVMTLWGAEERLLRIREANTITLPVRR